jgi:16S rRNA (cytidine1402-2'-O)-methyltransferase
MNASQHLSSGPRGSLYVVATPIGNLEDITLRALRILREVDVIACEDTRHSQKLLSHYEIKKHLVSYHEHNEVTRAAELVSEMRQGASVALVSDAGTPAISDPGLHLVRACVAGGIPVITIPGASALATAIAGAGLPSESVWFLGFLPSRPGQRRKLLRALSEMRFAESVAAPTLILYEAPHRITKTIEDCAAIFGARQAVIARELTKIHEEFLRGNLYELAAAIDEKPIRGEITLLIAPAERPAPSDVPAIEGDGPRIIESLAQRVARIERENGITRKDALKQAARELGIPRREAYKQLLAEKE